MRLALIGPSGAGKTYTALGIAAGLGGRVAVIDTEHGSASKYADRFAFDVLELEEFHPRQFVDAIHAAESEGYGVIVVDSLSHAWMGRGGALELVDRAAARSGSKNTFTAWRDVTPLHNALIDAIVQCKAHLIGTMRAKQEYVLEDDGRGKKAPTKVGMGPVQRDGMEFEFDVAAELTIDHRMIVTKTRCPALDGAMIDRPGADVAKTLLDWLSDGEPTTFPTVVTAPSNGNGHGDPFARYAAYAGKIAARLGIAIEDAYEYFDRKCKEADVNDTTAAAFVANKEHFDAWARDLKAHLEREEATVESGDVAE